MRPDRRERVDLRPDGQRDEEREEEADDGRDEHGAPEGEQERSGSGGESENRDDRGRIVDADRAQEQRHRERHGRDEHGRPTGDRRAGEDPEGGERDEPAHEHERRPRPRVVGPGEPLVEARERRRCVAVRAGANRWRLAGGDRLRGGSDVGERDEPVDPRRARREQAAVARPDDRDGIPHDVVVGARRRQGDVDVVSAGVSASSSAASPSRSTSEDTTRPRTSEASARSRETVEPAPGTSSPTAPRSAYVAGSNVGTTTTATERSAAARSRSAP